MDTVEKFPIWRKICFAVGTVQLVSTHNVIHFFFPIFILEVAQIPPHYASVILLTGEVWDAVSDPLCGYLVNKTETRFGKYRPWIFCNAPFLCIVYFCLWYVPEVTIEGRFAWYFLFYLLCQTCLTLFLVPYTSLTMVITNDQKERDSATAYRMTAGAIGALVSTIIQGQLVTKYRRAGTCGSSENQSTQLDGERWSYILGAIIGVGTVLVCSLVVVLGTREKRVNVAEEHRTCNAWRDIRLVVTFKPFVLLYLISMTTYMAMSISRGNMGLFCTHALQLGKYFANFMLTLMVALIVATPVWQLCLVRFGKKTTFAVGILSFLPLMVSVLLVKSNVYVYYVIVAGAGLCMPCFLLLPWSMLPDVLDEFYVKTGKRIDAIFYSFFAFFNKLGNGIALAVSQGILSLSGYKVGACSQPESVGLALRILMGPGLLLFIIVALVSLYLYPINEQRRAHNKTEMTLRANTGHGSETAMSPLSGEGNEKASPTEDAQDV